MSTHQYSQRAALAFVLSVLACSVVALWSILFGGGGGPGFGVGPVGFGVLAMYACVCSVVAARSASGHGRAAWTTLSVALATLAAAALAWSPYSPLLHHFSSPSLANALYVMFDVLAAVAITQFPTELTTTSWVRLQLDSLIAAVALLLLLWAALPASAQRAPREPGLATVLVCSVLDLFVVVVAVRLLARAGVGRRGVLGSLTAAFLLREFCDLAATYQMTTGHNGAAAAIGIGWALALVLLAAAALMARGPQPMDRMPVIDAIPSQRSVWLPYMPLLIASTVGPALVLTGPLQVGVPALMALVFIRQLSAARENRRLLRAAADRASHDPLTGLANRTLFYERLARAMELGKRDDRSVLVAVLDIDDFKMVNDVLGHPVADSALIGVAERLANCVQPPDTVARLGGDEFAFLLEGGIDRQHLVASSIVEAFDEPIVIDGQEILLWPSVGMAIASSDEPDLAPVALVQRADIAMYAAKRSRSSQMQTFSPDMTLIDPDLVVEWEERTARRPTHNGAAQIRLLRELRHATEHGELGVVYQPEIELSTGRIVRVEALLRWPHPQLGELRPEAFLSLVRQHGLMRQVSELVLDKALDDAARWVALGAATPVAVNLFAPLLCETRQLVDALAARNLCAELLTVEITEDAVLADVGRVTALLRELREIGVRVAIDDFGSGYSALSYLHDLPSDDVKLDRRFIAAVTSDKRAATVVRAVIDLAHELGMSVVAEGIEDAATVAWLREHGCDVGQGYHLGLPATAADTARFLATTRMKHFN